MFLVHAMVLLTYLVCFCVLLVLAWLDIEDSSAGEETLSPTPNLISVIKQLIWRSVDVMSEQDHSAAPSIPAAANQGMSGWQRPSGTDSA